MKKSEVIAAGLALFSMFFGAGDLIWPLILGGTAGDKNIYAVLGLLITGVSLPLLGLMAMMLFRGNYKAFFQSIRAHCWLDSDFPHSVHFGAFWFDPSFDYPLLRHYEALPF